MLQGTQTKQQHYTMKQKHAVGIFVDFAESTETAAVPDTDFVKNAWKSRRKPHVINKQEVRIADSTKEFGNNEQEKKLIENTYKKRIQEKSRWTFLNHFELFGNREERGGGGDTQKRDKGTKRKETENLIVEVDKEMKEPIRVYQGVVKLLF